MWTWPIQSMPILRIYKVFRCDQVLKPITVCETICIISSLLFRWYMSFDKYNLSWNLYYENKEKFKNVTAKKANKWTWFNNCKKKNLWWSNKGNYIINILKNIIMSIMSIHYTIQILSESVPLFLSFQCLFF